MRARRPRYWPHSSAIYSTLLPLATPSLLAGADAISGLQSADTVVAAVERCRDSRCRCHRIIREGLVLRPWLPVTDPGVPDAGTAGMITRVGASGERQACQVMVAGVLPGSSTIHWQVNRWPTS